VNAKRKLQALPRRWRESRRNAYAPQLQDAQSALHDAWEWAERLSIIGLFCLALGYTAYLTQSVLVPIVLALVAGTILAPVVDELVRRGFPRPMAVALVTIVALLIILGIVGLLSTPLTYWVGKTAELGALIKQKLQLLSQPMALFDEIAKALAEVSGSSTQVAPIEAGSSSIIKGMLSALTPIVTEFLLFFFAMIFFLLFLQEIKSGIIGFFSDSNVRDTAFRILEDVEVNLSKFFGTLAIVNLCLGGVAATMTWALGLPHPLLWGVLAATLNFIPYLGPAIMIAALFVIGLMNFQTLGQSLLAPVAYLSITTIEGQVLTPTIIGHRLTLNPFLVFLSIAFWAWMWGPIGAFLATPLLISAVIAVRHISGKRTGNRSRAFDRANPKQGSGEC